MPKFKHSFVNSRSAPYDVSEEMLKDQPYNDIEHYPVINGGSSMSIDNGNNSVASSVNGDDTPSLINDLADNNDWNILERRASKVNWNPNISLLELAVKLKKAERDVFGTGSPQSSLINNQSTVNNHQLPSTVPSSGKPELLDSRCKEQQSEIKKQIPAVHDPQNSSMARRHNELVSAPGSKINYFNGQQYIGSTGISVPMPNIINPTTLSYTQMLPTSSLSSGINRYSNSIPQVLPAFMDKYKPIVPKPMQCGTELDESRRQKSVPTSLDDLRAKHRELLANSAGQRPLPENRHHCEECSYETKSISHLRRHCATVHTLEKPYQCYICSMEFARSEKVRDHFINIHPDVAYEPHMTRKFPHGTMSRPPRDTPGVPVRTRIQQRIYDLFIDIEGNNVEMPIDPERPFGCLRCSYATRDLWHLRRHVLDIHATKKLFNCRVCRYSTNRPTRLHVHMRGHGELFCERCNFSSTRIEQFLLHDKLCLAGADNFRCRSCLADFTDRNSLRMHMNRDHGSDLMVCNLCSYFAFVDEDFVSHAEAHELANRTCQLCGITFETSADYDIHDFDMHLHTKSNSLLCNICNAVTDPPGNLKAAHEHVRSHSPVKVSCPADGCNFKAILELTVDTHVENFHGNIFDSTVQRRPLVKPEPIAMPQSPAPKIVKTPMTTSSPMTGTFACTICNRTPFKYYRSYEKHMAQHSREMIQGNLAF